jgi:hypothetical protein
VGPDQLRPAPEDLRDEDQDHRDDEGEQAEQLGGREADEQAALLAVGGARIAQRAFQEAAEDVADTDGGKAGADGGEARRRSAWRIGADHARCSGFHILKLPFDLVVEIACEELSANARRR